MSINQSIIDFFNMARTAIHHFEVSDSIVYIMSDGDVGK